MYCAMSLREARAGELKRLENREKSLISPTKKGKDCLLLEKYIISKQLRRSDPRRILCFFHVAADDTEKNRKFIVKKVRVGESFKYVNLFVLK